MAGRPPAPLPPWPLLSLPAPPASCPRRRRRQQGWDALLGPLCQLALPEMTTGLTATVPPTSSAPVAPHERFRLWEDATRLKTGWRNKWPLDSDQPPNDSTCKSSARYCAHRDNHSIIQTRGSDLLIGSQTLEPPSGTGKPGSLFWGIRINLSLSVLVDQRHLGSYSSFVELIRRVTRQLICIYAQPIWRHDAWYSFGSGRSLCDTEHYWTKHAGLRFGFECWSLRA
mmetsp:Transcript_19756/g.59700  ORF Transcript_19756/g.59700 Transcript_19756/m.59700 type:complete len:227 (-) Transcript_19756:116-796(-)